MKKIKLKVDEARKSDVGKQIARIPTTIADKLGVKTGDIISIKGIRTTYAIAWRSRPPSIIQDTIKMDSLIRKNAGVNIDDIVEINTTKIKTCENIIIKPLQQINASDEFIPYIKKAILNKIVQKGDLLSINTGFGGVIYLNILKIKPENVPSIINKNTQIVFYHSNTKNIDESSLENDYNDELEIIVPKVSYEDIGGLGDSIRKIREMIELPLRYPELFDKLGIQPPKGVLLYGPPGTGKTILAKAIANETSSYFINISAPEIISKYYGEAENKLREIFHEALKNSPSIIFIDEIDAITSKRDESGKEAENRLVAQLLTLMDGIEDRGNIVVIGATNRPNDIDTALRRGGRFDREIEIGIPDYNGRMEILTILTRSMPLDDDIDLMEVANLTHGYVGADLAVMTKEAALRSLHRLLPHLDPNNEFKIEIETLEKIKIKMSDFRNAIKETTPSGLREVYVETPNTTWEQIGGLHEIKEILVETLEWPSKYKKLYQNMNVKAPTGILLYGPPGTGKTLLAKAIANEIKSNFISIKGPELLSKWIGESEKGIREIFRKARSASPCIIFFDEFDAIATSRSFSNESSATQGIVSQLLTEIDGLSEIRDVTLLAATNRPDKIDVALIRSGRFDKALFIGLPNSDSRKSILEVQLSTTQIQNLDLEKLVKITENYSGAEISHLVDNAKMIAIKEYIQKNNDNSECETIDIPLTMEHFNIALSTQKTIKKGVYNYHPPNSSDFNDINIA